MPKRQISREELLKQADALTAACGEAVREALLFHKRNGHSVAGWRNGKVVVVPAKDIEVYEPLPNYSPLDHV
jgi:hypothetical protein